MTFKQVIKVILAIVYVGVLGWLSYLIVCDRNDIGKMYTRLALFKQQCEASGNHMERHTDEKGMPQLGCYEGPKAKLVKEFE